MTSRISRFAHDEDGAALVEFGLMLPVLMLVLALIVEGGRTFLSYQTAVSGLRDATRYLSRVVQAEACQTGATNVSGWEEDLTRIVRTAQSGETLFPDGVTVQHVRATLACTGRGYRNGAAPVATLTATLRFSYPFSGLAGMAGLTLEPITTRISDQARIVGT